MKNNLSLLLFFLVFSPVFSQNLKTENVILITMDGWRWQEMFGGADSILIRDKQYVGDTTSLINEFWAEDPISRREKIMPFFWKWISEHGQLFGNRWENNEVDLSNNMWFSYPGYNEILSGFADDERIDSNDKKDNPNTTVLEYLNNQPKFKGKVAVFGSWDVFPYIVNEKRSGIPVNAGWQSVSGNKLTQRQQLLNELQTTLPKEWETVRYDAITWHLAKEHIAAHKPRVLFISLGETDDYAHDGKFDHYLRSAHATDKILEDLWNYLQSQPQYKNKTTYILTTDHGRGDKIKEEWRHHGRKIEGADAVWLAVAGPDTPVKGEIKESGQLYLNQIAATLASFLGVIYESEGKTGKAVQAVMNQRTLTK